MNSKRKIKKYSKGARLFLYFNEYELALLDEACYIIKGTRQQVLRKLIIDYVKGVKK